MGTRGGVVTLSVLQVSTADRGGGAEAVALALHRALRARGVEAALAVGFRRTAEEGVLAVGSGRPRLRRALRDPRVALDVLRGREDFRFPASRRLLELRPRSPDVLHLHNLHGGYFDLRVLPALSRRVPTLVTMHDEWLYTGHCAYTLGCERWLEACGACPHLDVYPRLRVDGTAGNRARKAALYRQARLHLVAPSAWLLERARRSILAPAIASAHVIPNGVDLGVFAPGSREQARARLRLPADAAVLVFAAQGARSNPFKDFAALRAALERLHAPAVAVSIGEAAPPERVGRCELRSVGFLEPPALAEHLRAADLFVLATRADNHPLTVLEALACGTPVVASRVGGVPEQVTEATGVLVEPGDAEALAAAVDGLLADPGRRAGMGAAAVADARARFALERQVDAYLALYEEVAA
jgi:glycosyltransferase involved in cell wall biosynthesis